jgi:hypothetical protein
VETNLFFSIVLSAIQEDGDDSQGVPFIATEEAPSPILPSPKIRTRHLSTTSMVLPGGWAFSREPEGRPSLEVASGEFSPPPSSNKKLEAEDDKSKCVIM